MKIFSKIIFLLTFGIVASVLVLLYVDYVEFEQEKENVLPLIFEYCNDSSGIKNAIGYHYSNETHFINNTICEW